MATVYLARLEGVAGFQRLYAIKRLHPHLANEGEFVDMFLDEARLAARIHHPNVVSILEVGMSDRGYYLVMEYIEGDTAARLLARAGQAGGHLPTGAAVRIALDTLNGLHAAHELTDDDGQPLHIVHRDVSPQNILVGVDGVSRITDFGVAHAATRLSSTRTGQLKGKLAYMAPEQTRGAAVDRRSDVFAMGVVLWEMLAGKRLFKASNDAETLHRILYAPMPTLRGAGVDVPMPLDAVCMRALAREPEERYASAADFGDELERVGRSLGMLSTTREIATYVDGTIGAEISQQREVVRMWLSRSEPSRSGRPSIPGERRSSRNLGASSDFVHLRPESSLRERPSSRDVTVSEHSPAPAKVAAVSSVSSAVLEVPDGASRDASDHATIPPTQRAGAAGAPKKRRRMILWGVAASSGLTVAIVLGFAFSRGSAVSGGPVASSPPTASVRAPPAEITPYPSASVSSQVAQAPVASTARDVAEDPVVHPPTAHPIPPRATPGVKSGGAPPVVRPPRAGHASEDPQDDLSRNPYR